MRVVVFGQDAAAAADDFFVAPFPVPLRVDVDFVTDAAVPPRLTLPPPLLDEEEAVLGAAAVAATVSSAVEVIVKFEVNAVFERVM